MNKLNDLVKNLTPLDNTDAVRRKDNSYARNTEGGIIALSMSKSKIESLVLDNQAAALEHLYLSGNESLKQIEMQIPLPYVKHLYLDACALEELTIPEGCDTLEQIYVQKNKLKKLVFEGDCEALQLLDLSGNQLTEFTLPFGFDSLAYLYLNDNQLNILALYHALSSLNTLNLRNNQLNELPSILLESENLNTVYVHGNPMEGMDKNVLESDERANSWSGIRNYLSSLSDGTAEYDQVKLIVLGNSTAGKSSLIYFLRDKVYEYRRASTHGMTPILWEINKDFKIAIWDFGGQEYYHNIHHLFFTNKSLYAIIFEEKTNCQGFQLTDIELYENGTKTPKKENLEHFHYDYWLDNIHYLTQSNEIDVQKPELLLIQNKIELTKQDKDIKANFAISVEKSYEGNEDYIYAFKDFERNLLKKLKDIKGAVPVSKKWLAIKGKIQEKAKLGKPFLTKQEYIKLAEKVKEGISEKNNQQIESELDTLTKTLQRTGVILYYPEIKDNKENTFDLSDKIFINPEWLTDSIYRILDYSVQRNEGLFTRSHVEQAIKEKTINGQKIPAIGLPSIELLALMKGFQLIFEVNPTLNKSNEPTFITPQYLPDKCTEPRSINKLKEDILHNEKPTFILEYPFFMPKSVMPRFISKNGNFSKNPCWKYGINYAVEGTEILVECDFENRLINIWIEDKATKADLSKKVFDEFRTINDNNPKIRISKNSKEWVEIGKLLNHQESNKTVETTVEGVWVNIDDFAEFLDISKKQFFKDNLKPIIMISELKKQVGNLVGNAQTDKAIEVIESWAINHGDNDAQTAINLIKNEWKTLRKEENSGIAENVGIRRAKINHRILNFEWTVSATVKLYDEMPNPVKNQKIDSNTSHINSEIMKILFLAANPTDVARLETDKEHRLIKAEMERGSHRDKFEFLPPQFAVTITELLRAMNDKPQIVHFSGHGVEKGIIITTDDNTTQILPVSAIKRLFRPLQNIAKVVLLNACYSAAQAEEISKFGFYVVGYEEPIGDKAAIGFAQGLYNGLGEGKPFEDAYNDAMIVLITVASKYADIVEVWKDGKKLEL